MVDLSSRHIVADCDLGNLLYQDKAPINLKELTPSDIHQLTLNCTHNFMKQFFALPTENTDDVLITLLPDAKFRLPREKQAPKVREMTKWERFAQLKGIKQKKKSRKIWDEGSQTWKPRWGKDRIDNVKDKWCIEVPDNADPYEDQFEKLAKQRTERRAKNEFARLKNISRTVKKGKAPPIGVLPENDASKNELSRALEITKRSDASMGLYSKEINEQKIASKTEKKQAKHKKPGKKVNTPGKRRPKGKRDKGGRSKKDKR